MNKKIIISSLFILTLALFASVAYAQYPGEKIEKKTASIYFGLVPQISISHTPISRISENIRTVIATGTFNTTDITTPANIYAYIEYWFDGVGPSTASVSIVGGSGNKYGFESQPIILQSAPVYSSMTYRIVAEYPSGTLLASTTYITAYINAQNSGMIYASSGGSVVLESGNQKEGYASIMFVPNALKNNTTFSIVEVESGTLPSNILAKISDVTKSSSSAMPLISYEFRSVPDQDFDMLVNNSPAQLPSITMYYDTTTVKNANRLSVLWYDETNDQWVAVPASQIQKNPNGTVTLNLALTQTGEGYYAIFNSLAGGSSGSGEFSSNDYRPSKRALRPGDTMMFGERAFANNAPDIESVTIYTLKGKEIANLTRTSNFEWKGRSGTNNSGAFVESGSYIYQIKVNGHKVVSGSIVFVR